MSRDRVIDEVQEEWSVLALKRGMDPEALLNCAGHYLANVLLSIAQDEAAAHELMNRITEANHLYINSCWPAAKEKRDYYEQSLKRASREDL